MKFIKFAVQSSILFSLASYAWGACTNISSTTIISASATDCYDWSGGDFTIGSGATISAPSGSRTVDVILSTPLGLFTNNGLMSNGFGQNLVRVETTSSTVQSLVNNGSMTTSGPVAAFFIFGSTLNFVNTGTISQTDLRDNNGTVEVAGSGWGGSGSIDSLNNSGTISGVNGNAISVFGGGTVTDLTNNGSINSSATRLSLPFTYGAAIHIDATSSIGTLTNRGTVSTSFAGGAGVFNNGGRLNTLNNLQGAGNSAGALTYSGVLPTNYNVIVNSPSSYGKLSASNISGRTSFGIYSSSALVKGTYASVLSGLASSNFAAGGTSGTFNGTAWHLNNSSGSIWDLIVESSATNTAMSVHINANGLATVYNQQVAAYQAALSYDCTQYDTNNLCVSAGGRYTYAGPAPSANSEAAVVVMGYRPMQTLRVGGFVDQSVNVSTPTGFSQSKTSPMWGFFAKWNKNKDGNGLGVQASAVTSASKLSVTRTQLQNTEAGQGNTQLNGQGYQLTTNYHQPVTNSTKLVPYVGLRYTRLNAGGYTENTTETVTSPLNYNAMAQNTFSAIAGIGVNSHLAEKLTGAASVGIQQNLNYNMANYQGTSNITGLQNFSYQMPGNVNAMATASAGLYYDISKNERVGVNVLWQQQPFIATNTTTALATYTIGF